MISYLELYLCTGVVFMAFVARATKDQSGIHKPFSGRMFFALLGLEVRVGILFRQSDVVMSGCHVTTTKM